MRDPDRRRRLAFLGGLALLAGWAAALALLGSRGGRGEARGGGEAGSGSAPRLAGAAAHRRQRPAAAGLAVRFVAAYLRYEVGEASRADRETLARLATPRFGAQLRRAPLGAPPAPPGGEWVSRVEAVRVGVFEGRPALLVTVFVVGPGGGHPLTPTLLPRGSRWLIAGLGQ